MLTVKCPKCATGLKLKQAPAGGKVKCPKCGGVVPVGAAAAPAASGALLPDDDGFDFTRIQAPSAGSASVAQFPVKENLKVYDGPLPGDPNELDPIDDDKGPQEAVPAPVRAPVVQLAGEGDEDDDVVKKKSPILLILAIIAVLAVVGGGGAAAFMFLGGGDSGESSSEEDLPQVIIAP